MRYNKQQKEAIKRYVESVDSLEEVKKTYDNISFKMPHRESIIKMFEDKVRSNYEWCITLKIFN